MLQLLLRHRSTPPDAFARDHDRQQVSWLAGHRFGPPSQRPCPSPVAYYGRQLSAYSCGGSRGLCTSCTRTAFPWLALSGTTNHKRGIGSCRESIDCRPPARQQAPLVAAGPHRRSIDAIPANHPFGGMILTRWHFSLGSTLASAWCIVAPSAPCCGQRRRHDECVEFFNAHQEAFQAAARAKLLRTRVTAAANFHLTSRDVSRQLKN